MRKRNGVTLLELLVAVSMVGLLSLTLLMAIRFGFGALERTNQRLIANRRVLGVERVIEQQVAGLMPVTADCRPDAEGPPAKITFFQGDPQAMRFVSTFSLNEAARGYPRILEYEVIPGDKNEGVRLVVNERLYSGPISTGATCTGVGPDGPQFLPIPTGPQSFVLADRLAYCRILYREKLPAPDFERWTVHWGKSILPSAIRIEMAPLGATGARLQLTNLTMPVRVTRNPNPLEPYVN